MGTLVAAPDKFRGTASAVAVARAIAIAAQHAGWHAMECPLADGGEGLLDVVGGDAQFTTVVGPLGDPVLAEWRLIPELPGKEPRTAVVEMSRASGLILAGGKEHNDPFRATTYGTGQLIAAAIASGAQRIVVGCGGSATTDGGLGALDGLGAPSVPSDVEILVACDVTTLFVDAARVFGPQKGATLSDIEQLTAHLEKLAGHYRAQYGIDVTSIPGSGAAGGLAGGLCTLGARIVSGFSLVAQLVGLDDALHSCDLVITGEGHLDATSLQGKVIDGVIEHSPDGLPILCVVGGVDKDLVLERVGHVIEVISLVDRFGLERAMSDVELLIKEVVEQFLTGFAMSTP